MSRPAVFLDRDGTIIAERSYLADPDGVELVPGSADAMRRLRQAGYVVVVVTNQSGIARGLYSEDDYRAVAERVEHVLAARNAGPHATYYCPHHPDVTGPCDCRKPDIGMHLRAARDLDLDLSGSYYVGDKASDVVPAITLEGQGILVRTGYGGEQVGSVPRGTWVVEDLEGAARRILGESGPEEPPSRGERSR
ncbi:MAG: HAD-IIIA family hydrolase [Gemmatimonadetes bacterium]|nr:HAD-IIIA family hydrolase [Gemmatimonadota bacterium]